MTFGLLSGLLGSKFSGNNTATTTTQQAAPSNANINQFNAALNNAYNAGLSQGLTQGGSGGYSQAPVNIYNYAGGGSAGAGAYNGGSDYYGMTGHSHGQTGSGVIPGNNVNMGGSSSTGHSSHGSGYGSMTGSSSTGHSSHGSGYGSMTSGMTGGMTNGMTGGMTDGSHSGHGSSTGNSSGSAGMGGLIGSLLGGITGGASGGGAGGLLGGAGGGGLGGLGGIVGMPLGLFSNLVGHDSAAQAAGNGDVMGWLVNTFDHTGHSHAMGGNAGNGSSAPLAIAGTLGQELGGLVGLDKVFGSAQAYDAQNGTNYTAGGSPNYGALGGLNPLNGLLGGG